MARYTIAHTLVITPKRTFKQGETVTSQDLGDAGIDRETFAVHYTNGAYVNADDAAFDGVDADIPLGETMITGMAASSTASDEVEELRFRIAQLEAQANIRDAADKAAIEAAVVNGTDKAAADKAAADKAK